MGKIVKNIRNLDHDDVNQICKNHQVEDATDPDGFVCGEEKCPMWRNGVCYGYLFDDLDRIKSLIRETFDDEIIEVEY